MTPTEHKTEAETIMTAYEAGDPGKQYLNSRADLAEVHAILAAAAGTGSNYVAAEALLAKAAASQDYQDQARQIAGARVRATLADR